MRLVDADRIIQKINELSLKPGMPKKVSLEEACGMIIGLCVREAPTAYDVPEVVKQLEAVMDCDDKCREKFYYGQGCSACLWGRCIAIVKEGIK